MHDLFALAKFLLLLSRWSLCSLVGLSVLCTVCMQDYCKSNQPISLQLYAMMGLPVWCHSKAWLQFPIRILLSLRPYL